MSGYWYLATPYSKYPDGVETAFVRAAEQSAILIGAGIPVFCPITHTHPIAMTNTIPNKWETWIVNDTPLMDAAKGIIVCMMKSWEISQGILHEIEYFSKQGKPVKFMIPGIVPNIE